MRNLLLGTLAALTTAAPAHAVTFSSVGAVATANGPQDPGFAANETVLADFDHAPLNGVTLTVTGPAGFYSGSYSGLAAAPAGDTSRYLALGTGGMATLMLHTVKLSSLSVYLGSIDSYNAIDVLNRAGNIIKTWSGNDLPPHDGNWLNSDTNRRLFLSFAPGDDVGAVRFKSTGVAFEFDTIAGTVAGVPEPANWALMIGGFGMIGGAMRRRSVTKVCYA